MPSSPLSSPSLLAAVALLAAAPAVASGAPGPALEGRACSLSTAPNANQGPALVDRTGFRFDVSANISVGGQAPSHYATLAEGSSTAVTDAYDDWGDLYVGATQSDATRYVDADQFGCQTDPAGRELAFGTVTIGGLQVQRKLFVSGTTGSGARLVQSVKNPGSAPVTTSVFVGDLTGHAGRGSLGADAGTTLNLTSSGDTALAAGDRWAVTSDSTASDPALAHVWDGAGGATAATIVRSGAQPGSTTLSGTPLALDRFGYGWQDVTIPAGATASFLSWEAVGVAVDPAEEIGLAEDAAVAVAGAPHATIFEGMSAAEIRAVRNWAKPTPTVAIAPIAAASADADVVLATSSVHFADASMPQCDEGTLHWNFGDGATAVAPGGSHRFSAGTANVSVTAKNVCGGETTTAVTFLVGAKIVDPPRELPTETPGPEVEVAGQGAGSPVPTPASTPAPTPTPTTGPTPTPTGPIATPAALVVGPPTATGSPAAPPAQTPPAALAPAVTFTVPESMKVRDLAKKGLGTGIVATANGPLRVVLSGGGIKLVKTMTLAPGAPRTPTFKFSPADVRALATVKTLKVRAKLILVSGQEIITTKTVTVRP